MTGRRHLTLDEAEFALRRGAQVEQMLGIEPLPGGGPRIIRWLAASRLPRLEGLGFRLWLLEVQDVTSEGFRDITEFPSIDPDPDFCDGRVVATTPEPRAVLLAAHDYGAKDDRWVNQGVIQSEYNDLRATWSDG
jgi:hypothetical protein